jgi:hypothetical protein
MQIDFFNKKLETETTLNKIIMLFEKNDDLMNTSYKFDITKKIFYEFKIFLSKVETSTLSINNLLKSAKNFMEFAESYSEFIKFGGEVQKNKLDAQIKKRSNSL